MEMNISVYSTQYKAVSCLFSINYLKMRKIVLLSLKTQNQLIWITKFKFKNTKLLRNWTTSVLTRIMQTNNKFSLYHKIFTWLTKFYPFNLTKYDTCIRKKGATLHEIRCEKWKRRKNNWRSRRERGEIIEVKDQRRMSWIQQIS